jgi:hypothetical protein
MRGKEIELQILCDAVKREHDESLSEIEANNRFLLDCYEQDIDT